MPTLCETCRKKWPPWRYPQPVCLYELGLKDIAAAAILQPHRILTNERLDDIAYAAGEIKRLAADWNCPYLLATTS